MYMEGRAPAARGSGGGVGGCSAAGGDLAAAGQVGTASGNGVAAAGVVVTFNRKLQVPAAARPWFLGQGSDGEKAAVVVYGRRPDGSVRPHNVALHRTPKSWRLIGTVSLLNELDVHGGDSVRLTREQVAAAGCGAVAAGAGLAVVVEKVAGQQQQQSQVPHHRRHVRTVEPVDPPLDPSGPSAGRVVVSRDRRFMTASMLQITKDVVPCLLQGTRIEDAKAAASMGGTTPKYVVTVFARRTAGDGSAPTPFQDVKLTPSRGNTWGNLVWILTGVGPLRQHLGLAPRSPVRLVREVGQDGRVRLVVEPRGEGEGGAGGGGEGKGKGKRLAERVEAVGKGKKPAQRVVSDTEGEDGDGLLQGGDTSYGSEEADEDSGAAGGSDGEESCDGENTGSEDPDWVPGEGGGQGAEGAAPGQQQDTQPLPPLAQQQQREPRPQQPPQQATRVLPQSQSPTKPPQQQPGPGGGGGGGNDAWQPQPQPQQQVEQQQPLGTADDGGGDGAGPAGAVGPGGVEGRPSKWRRLEITTEQAEKQPAGQDGLPAECGDDGDPLDSVADLLLAEVEGSRATLAAAEARAAALAVDKAALEGQLAADRGRAEAAEGQLSREREARKAAQQQLARERDRAEAAEVQLRRVRQRNADVLRRAGLAVGGHPAAVQQPQPQPPRMPGTPA